jgi:hypothetical protein
VAGAWCRCDYFLDRLMAFLLAGALVLVVLPSQVTTHIFLLVGMTDERVPADFVPMFPFGIENALRKRCTGKQCF